MHVLARVCGALQLNATAGEASGSSFPNLLRTHVVEDRGERRNPGALAHGHIIGNGSTYSDFATALKVDRADPQMLTGPTSCLNVRSRLDRDVVPEGDQIEWPMQVSILGALKIPSDFRSELSQHKPS